MTANMTIRHQGKTYYLTVDCAGSAVDAFITEGVDSEGRRLSDDLLDELQATYEGEVQECAYEGAMDYAQWSYSRK